MPLVVKALAIGFLLAHLAYQFVGVDTQGMLLGAFAIIPDRFAAGTSFPFHSPIEMLGPLFGHVFLHGDWAHVVMNTLVFLYVAPNVVQRLGTPRFVVLFLASATASAAAFIFINLNDPMVLAVGASGAISGLFAANIFASTPDWRDALKDRHAQNTALMFLVLYVGAAWALSAANVLPIAWEAHLGGFIAGGLLYPLLVSAQRQLDS